MENDQDAWSKFFPPEESEETRNKDIIEIFLEKYSKELLFPILKEEELHQMFSDIYVYPNFKEATFKVLATLKDKQGRTKGKTVQLYHLGVRKKKELYGEMKEEWANALISSKMVDFITFTYLFAIQQRYREIADLRKMSLDLNEQAVNLF